jgi:Zn ribbon nucleic-acid-binding protein
MVQTTFKSWDYDTQEIIVEIKCAHCGHTDRKSLSELAEEMDEENPTIDAILTHIQQNAEHWKDCKTFLEDEPNLD